MFYFKSESLKTTELGLLSRHTKVQGTFSYKLISHAGETIYSILEPVRATQTHGFKDRHVGSVRIGPRILCLVVVPTGFGSWVPLWTVYPR